MRRPCWCTKQWQNVTHILHNNRIKFPKYLFTIVLYPNMAAVTSCENGLTFISLWREPLQECATLNINLASFPRVFPPGMAVLSRLGKLCGCGSVQNHRSVLSVLSRSQARVATCFVWNEPCCRPWRFTFTFLGCFTHFYSWATFVARNVRRLPRSPGSICQVTTF